MHISREAHPLSLHHSLLAVQEDRGCALARSIKAVTLQMSRNLEILTGTFTIYAIKSNCCVITSVAFEGDR